MAFNSSSDISEKLARLGRRPESHDLSILEQKEPSLPRFPTTSSSTLPGFEGQCKQEFYMHYTISTDRSGTQDQVAASILSVLGSKQAKWGAGVGEGVEAEDLPGAKSGIQEDPAVPTSSAGEDTLEEPEDEYVVAPVDLEVLSNADKWDGYRGMIIDLHENHHFSLSQIANFMYQEYKILARSRTYMSKLTSWMGRPGLIIGPEPTDAWWDLHKPIISELYLLQNRSAYEIDDLLVHQHYVNPGVKSDCKNSLKRWGLWKGVYARPRRSNRSMTK